MSAYEVNFDGLIGPTHNYGALSWGNRASMTNWGEASSPRAAALEGLEKMKRLHDLGVCQGVLPPLARPCLGPLRQLGFGGNDEDVLTRAGQEAPELLAACWAASAMWAANSATVTPSRDSADAKVHFTAANLISKFHRSLEADQTAASLRAIFADADHFRHHDPLPRADAFSDEGRRTILVCVWITAGPGCTCSSSAATRWARGRRRRSSPRARLGRPVRRSAASMGWLWRRRSSRNKAPPPLMPASSTTT
jgi:succinylarginine dihydrolase